MPIGEKQIERETRIEEAHYNKLTIRSDSKPIGNLEDAQRRYHQEQSMYLVLMKSYMGLLPMDDYIQTYTAINNNEVLNYADKNKKI